MKNKKKINDVVEDVKIVSRPTNEELADDIVDDLKEKNKPSAIIKHKKNEDFGNGIED